MIQITEDRPAAEEQERVVALLERLDDVLPLAGDVETDHHEPPC